MASMLTVFLDVCRQPYGWMSSLEMRLSIRIRSGVKWVLNENNAYFQHISIIFNKENDKTSTMNDQCETIF